MKKLVIVSLAGLVVGCLFAVFATSAHAGFWFADVVVTPAPCVPAPCAPRICTPAPCAVAVMPCRPVRIGFWTASTRPCGEPTYNEYNTATGSFNQIIDVGLNASGHSAVRFGNATGGWTVLKQPTN